jgi:hypothetical protein
MFHYFVIQSTFKSFKMDQQQEQLDALKDIRSMMERSSKFLSLSGLSGIVVGLIAIAGVMIAYTFLGIQLTEPGYYNLIVDQNGVLNNNVYQFLFVELILLLVIALATAIYLAMRNALSKGLPVWDATAKRLLINMAIPLTAGAIYCSILLYHGHIALIAPATIIFYGLSILNASKYTIHDIRSLGVLEIVIGLIASIYVDYGLLFWALGFGVLHIVYGLYIYFKYEK